MGQCLAKPEAKITQIEWPAKQHRQQIMRAATPHRVHQQRKPFRVMRRQPIKPRMQAIKRFAVGRQHQHIFGECAETIQGFQEGAERIGGGLPCMQANIR